MASNFGTWLPGNNVGFMLETVIYMATIPNNTKFGLLLKKYKETREIYNKQISFYAKNNAGSLGYSDSSES